MNDARTPGALAAADIAQRAQATGRGSVFQQVATGSRVQRLPHILLVFMHRQIDNAAAGAMLFDQPSRFERRHAGHADVEKHQVGTVLQREFQSLRRVLGFGDHDKIGRVLEQAPHAVTHEFVIVGDHAANTARFFRPESVQFSWSTRQSTSRWLTKRAISSRWLVGGR